jgi:hypothetical protein
VELFSPFFIYIVTILIKIRIPIYKPKHKTMKTPEDYIKEVKAASDLEWQKNGYDMTKSPVYYITQGKKFTKVLVTTWGQTSVHCFIDSLGNLYKAATYNAPAKGIRGNISADKKPLLCADFYRR